ncbi:MAG: hypothetical protein E7365_00340 [Clostridiales bacterium]|nr:hypothetical protein [Clostridiales bacterium]
MNLLKRVISAAVLILIIVGAVFLGKISTVILASIVCFFMMFDVVNALNKGEYKVNKIVLLLSCALIFPAIYFLGITGYFIVISLAFSILTICVIFSKTPDIKSLLASVFALIYPLLPGALLVLLTTRDLFNQNREGIILCVGAVLCATLADTFAYFFGILLGRRKLCPVISPKKTIAGSIASFFGGAFGGLLMALFFKHFSSSVYIYDWIVIGVACGGFAQIGDLTASLIKRHCNVKDYGTYIPGHGGIMDRMDSISICLIAIYIYVQLFIPEFL